MKCKTNTFEYVNNFLEKPLKGIDQPFILVVQTRTKESPFLVVENA